MSMDLNLDRGRTFTLDELAEKYPRQWLAVNVAERDSENGQPVRVTVLTREVDVYTARNNAGTQTFCTMYTGTIPEVKYLGMF